ncbi:hypothetical protein CLD22_26290 [Rubrivivax gelatinosus]|nr:hypothetical protein [Rubrivivax gelatinosus]
MHKPNAKPICRLVSIAALLLVAACSTPLQPSTPATPSCPKPPAIPGLPESLKKPVSHESYLDGAQADTAQWQQQLTRSATR